MMKGGEVADNGCGMSDLGLNEEGPKERVQRFSRQFDAEEREGGLIIMRGNDGGFSELPKDGSLQSQLQMLPGFKDHSLSSRDSNTTRTKFQWMNLLAETSNSKVDGAGKDSQGCGCECDNLGRKYVRLVEKPLSIESERIKNLPTYVHSVGIAQQSGLTKHVSSPPVKDGGGFLVKEYPPHLARGMSRKDYEEGNHLNLHTDDHRLHSLTPRSRKHFEVGCHLELCSDDRRSPCLTPRSPSSGQHNPSCGNLMENLQDLHHEALHHPTDSFRNSGNIHQARCTTYQQKLYPKADATYYPLSNKAVSHPGAEHSPNMDMPRYYIHPESQRYRKVYSSAVSNNVYDQIRNGQDYDDQGVAFANNALDHKSHRPNIGNWQKHVIGEDRLQSFGQALLDEPTLDNYDMSGPVNDSEYFSVMLGGTNANTYLSHGTQSLESHESLPSGREFIESHERLPPGEERAYVMDDHHMYYEEQDLYFSGSDGGVCTLDEHTQQRLKLGYVFCDEPDRMLKRKDIFVGDMSRSKRRTTKFYDKYVMSYEVGQLAAEPEKEQLPPSWNFSQYGRDNVGVPKTEPRLPFSGLSESLQSRLSKPHESGSADVKKRLKHTQIDHHRSIGHRKSRMKNPKRFMKPSSSHVINSASAIPPYDNAKSKSAILRKKFKADPRIDLVPPATTQGPQVLHPGATIEWQHKPSTKKLGSAKEDCRSQEANPYNSKLKVKPAEKDLPEGSEEFKRQVDEWFLKSMLHLNANPDRQSRFKDQGNAGSLKCIVCSSSKDFMDTKDIATHAFASLKVGLRAPHMGFHKALCVLMGWDSAAAPNGRWVHRPLLDAKAWALREDIIVWPPVVIIHNIYGGNYPFNDLAKISNEHLGNILNEKGFDIGKTKPKVCLGGAGNSNIAVLKFSGTISGLQEAERLHHFFNEKKHGRNELQQFCAGVSNSNRDDPQMPVGNAESTLYGYLGIVEDLHKLHHHMKLHRHAKSKKQILAFANAAT